MAVIKKLDDMGMYNYEMINKVALREPGDFKAALNTSGKNFAKKPAVFARWAEGEIEIDAKTGKQTVHHAGELKEKVLGGIVSNWDAAQIRTEVDKENFTAAMQDNPASEALATSISYSAFEEGFQRGRNHFQTAKRAEIAKWVAENSNKAYFNEGNGLRVKEVVERFIRDESINGDTYDELVKYAYEGDPAKGRMPVINSVSQHLPTDWKTWTVDQKKSYIVSWMNHTP